MVKAMTEGAQGEMTSVRGRERTREWSSRRFALENVTWETKVLLTKHSLLAKIHDYETSLESGVW